MSPRVSRAIVVMRCSKLLVNALFMASISLTTVQAGDEVDYSAPYLTVENGELVTKYPAAEHAASAEALEAGVDDATQTARDDSSAQLLWGIFAAVAVLISIVVFRRRSH